MRCIYLLLPILCFGALAYGKEASPTKACQLTYLTKSDLSEFRSKGSPVGTLSHAVNAMLKSSFDLVNTIDHYTLGLASSLTIGRALDTWASFEDIKPNQWNRIIFAGSVIYKSSPLAVAPVRGAKITLSFEKQTEVLTSGTRGEFAVPFFELVPYTRFRLFPFAMIEHGERLVKTLKIPLSVKIESPVCSGRLKIVDLPTEPITFILSTSKRT